jgi:hypothetical protein
VDLDEGVLRIRQTKFGKSRLVAVYDSTRQVLADYACQRDQVVGRAAVRDQDNRCGIGDS